MLPISRKSVEPLAAHADPSHVRAKHQALHHFVANAPWSDRVLLDRVQSYVQPHLGLHRGTFWIVDDTGHPKCGTHSVGVARQYCGQLGKIDNCHVAVSLSLATDEASVPVDYRLYLSQEWAKDSERRRAASVPDSVRFATKPQIALAQIRAAQQRGVPPDISLKSLVNCAKMRWRIEHDYHELKQEFGLSHYEGRGWPGFHHHAALCVAAYDFLTAQRLKQSSKKNATRLQAPALPEGYQPRGGRSNPAPRPRLHPDASLSRCNGARAAFATLPLL